MAKKPKKSKKNPENPPENTGEFTESFPTEGFTDMPQGMTGDHGMPTEGFSSDHGVAMPTEGFTDEHGASGDFGTPTEGFPAAPDAPTGMTGEMPMPTEDLTGEFGVLPTEDFAGGAPPPMGNQDPTLAVRRGTPADELDELDDVLVLLPDEDDAGAAPTSAMGNVGTQSFGTQEMAASGSFGSTAGDTAHIPGTESPTGVEDVQLLAQHPEHGLMPADELPEAAFLDELPDIEDVEDITALVEEAVASELPAPMTDFEDEYVSGPPAPRGRSTFGMLMRTAALVAILVAGAMYGPELYDQYLGEGRTAVASRGGDNPGTNGGTEDPGTGTDPGTNTDPNGTTDPGTVVAADVPVEFQNWVDGVLAQQFGAPSPDGR